VRGQEVKFSPREYDVLRLLVAHAGKVLTRRFLLHEVWGGDVDVQYLLSLKTGHGNAASLIRSDRQLLGPDMPTSWTLAAGAALSSLGWSSRFRINVRKATQ
jgi:hypothetical protein